MEVISSAKSTILSDYPTFKTKFEHHHKENEASDFQFFAGQRLFLEVNKKSGLEFFFIKNGDDNNSTISRVRRMRMENLYCVACPKSNDDVALGYSNGNIKLFNYKTFDVTKNFSGETNLNSVIFLDFNASDEYLASVYENGVINLYGIKTKVKMESLYNDKSCTLCRFHPVKRFHLAIACYSGSVLVYDINKKSTVYQSDKCHVAPCRDLCMSPELPHLLFSAGYDCLINIFDTRKKAMPQQIRCEHPLSTIAVSACGNYFCVGNLKGDLLSYDIRNIKTNLSCEKIHDGAVVRVAFVPNDNNQNYNSFGYGSPHSIETSEEFRRSPLKPSSRSNPQRRDSFFDFLDFQTKIKDKSISRFSTRRDSYDWEALGQKYSDVPDFRRSTTSRLSCDIGLIADSRHTSNLQPTIAEDDEIETPIKMNKAESFDTNKKETTSRYSLKQENHSKINGGSSAGLDNADKENILNLSNKEIECFFKLPDDKNSTPNNVKRPTTTTDQANKSANLNYDITNVNAQLGKFQTEFEKFQTEIKTRVNNLESEFNFSIETAKWNILIQNVNLWSKQKKMIEEIRAGMDILLQTEPFVNEYLRLQQENADLKEQLKNINK